MICLVSGLDFWMENPWNSWWKMASKMTCLENRPKTPSRRPKTLPRCPQDAPKTAQDAPKTSPRRPKTPPRHSQDAPKPLQDSSKTLPSHPKPPPDNVFGMFLGILLNNFKRFLKRIYRPPCLLKSTFQKGNYLKKDENYAKEHIRITTTRRHAPLEGLVRTLP